MRRALLSSVALIIATSSAYAQPGVQWIWSSDASPRRADPQFFRKTFNVPRPVDDATLDITADRAYAVWVNGQQVGTGDDWMTVKRFDVRQHLHAGPNTIAVRATAGEHTAGLLVRLGFIPNGMSRLAVVSDGTWHATGKPVAADWTAPEFNDRGWPTAKVIGPVAGGPWKGLTWEAGGDDRFTTQPGFHVEKVADAPAGDAKFSLINMCFDARGRLFLSRERGPVLICTDPDARGVYRTVRPYCDAVTGCQGMCWVGDSLYLVGGGPRGARMVRVRDANGNDKIDPDEVTVLHTFPQVEVPGYGRQGGMGEHGPHAVIHGPDDMMYLVVGNHAWAKPEKLAANSPLRRWPDGQMGPDQDKPNTTEDTLLPRMNDGRGHASNILAPGGTIWRFDKDAKEFALVSAGYRNHFDAAFSPFGELFTFDSDMEWDEGLPWYRAVRVVHAPPGSDFVWRTGASNTPSYYLDSLPPIGETGRGSPVGVEFYDHFAFPKKYRGAYFLGDWALGIIYAVFLDRDGASYKPRIEKFCTGTPMNVTDLAVGPDGALYFTMGGRDTEGGIYRIVADKREEPASYAESLMRTAPQPLAPWGRKNRIAAGSGPANALLAIAKTATEDIDLRLWALKLGRIHGFLLVDDALELLKDKDPLVRAEAVAALGMHGTKRAATEAKIKAVREALDRLKEDLPDTTDHGLLAKLRADLDATYQPTSEALTRALDDKDPMVRRRACEALVRAGIEPPVPAVWPLLGDPDRFVRTAARRVVERIDVTKWAARIEREPNDQIAWQAIVALCQTNQTGNYQGIIFNRLAASWGRRQDDTLDWLRTVQLAMIHCQPRPVWVAPIARQCEELFPRRGPQADSLNRELAVLLTHFQKEGFTSRPVQPQLLAALAEAKGDRQQQIYYFLCLRVLKTGWTPEEKDAALAFYESTKDWTGGFSLPPFLDRMFAELTDVLTPADRIRVMQKAEQMPKVALALLRSARPEQLPPPSVLAGIFVKLGSANGPGVAELRTALVDAIGRGNGGDVAAALRKIADGDPTQIDVAARGLARFPTAENAPYLVRGLSSPNPLVLLDCVEALTKAPYTPKPEDGAAWRAALVAAGKLQSNQKWKAVELLRHWSNGRQFGAETGDWKNELAAWTKWFGQAYPLLPALAAVADPAAPSKYRFEDLRAYLTGDAAGLKADPLRGRMVFAKAQCAKCHKYGTLGEGVGPDLTTLAKRFKRADTLESLLFPSKVISDQYRSTTIETKRGQRITGLAAPQIDGSFVVLQQDGTKVTVRKEEIEARYASLISVMPEKLLDELTRPEIADLFAFLESDPQMVESLPMPPRPEPPVRVGTTPPPTPKPTPKTPEPPVRVGTPVPPPPPRPEQLPMPPRPEPQVRVGTTPPPPATPKPEPLPMLPRPEGGRPTRR